MTATNENTQPNRRFNPDGWEESSQDNLFNAQKDFPLDSDKIIFIDHKWFEEKSCFKIDFIYNSESYSISFAIPLLERLAGAMLPRWQDIEECNIEDEYYSDITTHWHLLCGDLLSTSDSVKLFMCQHLTEKTIKDLNWRILR